MDDNKTLIDSIKSLMQKFGFLKEDTEFEFLDAKLQDGTIVRTKDKAIGVGSKITIISDTGETPAPDGEYTLEDESTFVVKNGVVESLGTPPAPDATPADSGSTAPDATMPMTSEQMTEFMDLVKEFIGKCGDKINAMEVKNSEMEAKAEEMSVKIAEFSKLPAGVPIPNGKTIIEKEQSLVDSRLSAIAGMRNKK